MRWVGHAACVEALRNLYIILVGMPKWKRFRKTEAKRDDNVKMGLKEIGLGLVDWICGALDRDQW
jgi:hypothetical protein